MGGKWLEPHLGRETFLVKVDWVDDWPIFNNGKNISIVTEGRDSIVQAAETEGGALWQADLTKDDLEPGWYQKRKALLHVTVRGIESNYGLQTRLSRSSTP
jgi:beta-xylosidase